MEADSKRRIGTHFISVRQTVQSAMAQVRKVREEQPDKAPSGQQQGRYPPRAVPPHDLCGRWAHGHPVLLLGAQRGRQELRRLFAQEECEAGVVRPDRIWAVDQ